MGTAGFSGVYAGLKRLFYPRAEYPINQYPPFASPGFSRTACQRQALEYGVKVSGCTVHFVDEGMDTGPIILQEAVPVFERMMSIPCRREFFKAGAPALPGGVRLIALDR